MNYEKLKAIIAHFETDELSLQDVLEFLAKQEYHPFVGVSANSSSKVYVTDYNILTTAETIKMAMLKYLGRL